MFQQLLAIIIILFFIGRLFWQRRRSDVGGMEFYFWMIFWILALVSVAFIKKIDMFVAGLGFSASGIDVLFYLAVMLLFYFVLRIRIKLEGIERNLTVLVREDAIGRGDVRKKMPR